MPSAVRGPQTLYDKVLESHIVDEKEDGTLLLYIGQSDTPQDEASAAKIDKCDRSTLSTRGHVTPSVRGLAQCEAEGPET